MRRFASAGAPVAALAAVTYLVTLGKVVRADRARPGPYRQVDAVVVLGGKVYPRGPSSEMRARLEHARDIWLRGGTGQLIMTGGVDGDLDESQIMARYLADRGVPADRIESINTGHNTRASLTALTGRANRFVAVSSRYHTHRLRAEAHRQGLDVVVDCPTSSPEVSAARTHLVRLQEETLACILYAAPRWLSGPVRLWIGDLRYSLPNRISPPARRVPPIDPAPR